MSRSVIAQLLACLVSLPILIQTARAEPYLAVHGGYKCVTCHLNPTGGGLRNDFGLIYAKNILPASTSGGAADQWSGKLGEFLRLGGDLRANWTRNEVPRQQSQQKFVLDQARLYGEISVIRDRLSLYIDEQVAPNSAQNLEAYVRWRRSSDSLYLKGGKFYLPFGWRLQDQTAFVREVTGISMTNPDQGLELGLERQQWSAQIALTNGSVNSQSGSGHQVTGQVVFVQPDWRAGIAASQTRSEAGNRRVYGLFTGVRTGPVAWLAEADLVSDDGYPQGNRKLGSLLGEANWQLAGGHNLKIAAEYYEPDRNVSEDQQTRWSLLYEYTPIQFLQLRAGFRRYRGIPQSATQNRRLSFLELHGYF